MAIKKYAIHAIKLLGAAPITLSQATQRTVNPKPTVIYNSGSGQFSPSFAAVAGVEPEVTFDSTEIARILTAVPVLTGLGINTGLTYTGAEIYYEGKQDMGGRVGNLLSLKHVATKSMLVVRSITCEQRGEARSACTLMTLSSDGVAAPLTTVDLVTAPNPIYATEKFTLGPVVINGARVNGVIGVTIDFGLEIVASMEAGETYPKFCTINRLEPKITVRTNDISLITSFPFTGTNLSSGAVVYLRRFQQSGIVYADGSAQHVSFTLPASQGIALPGQGTGSGAGDATLEIDIRPLAGSSAMVTVNPATTIV
jgi:hypothetical protein